MSMRRARIVGYLRGHRTGEGWVASLSPMGAPEHVEGLVPGCGAGQGGCRVCCVRAQPQLHKQRGRNLKIHVAIDISEGVLVKKLPAALLRTQSWPAKSLRSGKLAVNIEPLPQH